MKKSFAFTLVFQLFALISYTQKLQPFYENGKYGYKSGTQVVVQPKYEYAADFSEGKGAIKLDGKWGFIDEAGDILIQPKYAKVEKFENGFARFYVGKKFGVINAKGEQVVDAVCDLMQPSLYGYGLVLTSNGKKAWASPSTGKVASPFKYDYIELEEHFVQCRVGEEYDIYTSKGAIIATNCMESQTFGTSFNAPLVDINFPGRSYLADSNGVKVSEDFAYIELQEVNYHRIEAEDRNAYQLLFCYYNDTIEKMKLVRLDGYMLDGIYTNYNYSNERTMFQKDGVPYWFNNQGEMERLNYFNFEEMYEFLVLTTGKGTQLLAQVAKDYNVPELFTSDTVIIDTFSSIRGLYVESYDDYNYYDGDYIGQPQLNVSRIIEVEGLNENKGKYALYDLFWRKIVTPYDDYKKEIREDLLEKHIYVFTNQKGHLGAIVDGKMLEYKYSNIQKYPYNGYVFTDTLDNQSFFSLSSRKWTSIPKNYFVINSLNYGLGEPMTYFDEQTGEEYTVEATPKVRQEFVMLGYNMEEYAKYGFIDANANVIEPQFDSITDDMDFIVEEAPERIILTWKNGKCGAYNLDFGLISQPVFDSTLKFKYDLFTNMSRAKIPGQPRYISSGGKQFIGTNFEPMFFKENGKTGAKEYTYFDDEEELIVTIQPLYKELNTNGELPYMIEAQNAEKKFGLLHLETGDTLIPFNFTKLLPKDEYYGYTENDHGYYYEVYNKKNIGLHEIASGNSIPAVYTSVHPGYNSDADVDLFYVHNSEGKVGLYSRNLIKLLDCEYDGITVQYLNDYRLIFATKGNKVYAFNYMFNQVYNLNPKKCEFDFVVGTVGYRKTNAGYDAFDIPSFEYLGSTNKISLLTVSESEEMELTELNGTLAIRNKETGENSISGLRLVEFMDGESVITFEDGVTYYQSIYNKKSKYPASSW